MSTKLLGQQTLSFFQVESLGKVVETRTHWELDENTNKLVNRGKMVIIQISIHVWTVII